MSVRLIISIHYVSKFMLCITLDRIMCNMMLPRTNYSSFILFYEKMSHQILLTLALKKCTYHP